MLNRLLPLIFASATFAQIPTITDVVSFASLPGSQSSLSVGSRAQIFGSNLENSTASKVSVMVGGKPAPVVSNNRFGIDVQIPFEVPPGPSTLTVTVAGIQSVPFPIRLNAYAPGILSCVGTSPCDFGSFLNVKGNFTQPSNPAFPGDLLLAYAVGLGPTNPPTPTGAAPTKRPTAFPVSVTIGSTPAEVSFAGLELNSIGSYDVNFKVPQGLQGTQPLFITVAGNTSNPVNIPLFGISAIVSNASFGSRGTIAPNSIISVFANGLGNVSQSTGFPSTNFQGVSVAFNGTPAPLVHLTAFSGQIDLIVPAELPTSGTVAVQLKTPTGTSNSVVTMAPAVPAFYRIADPFTPTRFNVIAQFSGTAWLAMPALMAFALNVPGSCTERKADPLTVCVQPASPGDFLVLYATGLGKTTPDGDPSGTALPTGATPPANGSVLYKTVTTPIVTMGGVPAAVLYSGLAPGFPGLYQINVQVPTGVAPGDDVPVVLSLPGGAGDNTVTLSIRTKP